jgi:hypothetical protein
MPTELKKAIVDYIIDNLTEFSLHNSTTNKFRAYIFDSEGEYLIGGERVSEFIDKSIKLLV